MKFYYALALCSLISMGFAQNISGHIPFLAHRSIKLEAFYGFNTYTVDSVYVDGEGGFDLQFSDKHYGMGLIRFDGMPVNLLILTSENIKLSWLEEEERRQFHITEGSQNLIFQQYISEQFKREQALRAWSFLEHLYRTDSLFALHTFPQFAIAEEIGRIQQEDDLPTDGLADEAYVKWYVTTRKLLSSLAPVAQSRPEEIPATLKRLREIDYGDVRLYKSGLLREAIDSHIWFIENSSVSLDTVLTNLNRSIDHLLEQLALDEVKYREVTNYLFELLEKRSLSNAAEYLAIKLMNDRSCSLEEDMTKRLEGYLRLKSGSIAPDICFSAFTYFPEELQVNCLSQIEADFKVVVFAASWCPHCREDIPKLAKLYKEWKTLGIEVVLVSLDENLNDFARFTGDLPFISTSDLLKWKGKAVEDYHIFATPTMFLLNSGQEIVLKPESMEHLMYWVDSHLMRE